MSIALHCKCEKLLNICVNRKALIFQGFFVEKGRFMRLYLMYSPITATPYRRDKTYVEVAPCKELAPYIKCFWGSDTPYEENFETGGKPIIIIPDTCMDIIFNLNYTNSKINSSFIGINAHSFPIFKNNSKKTVSTFAIRFYPWSTYLFSEDSLLNTKNQSLDLEYRFKEGNGTCVF